MVNKTHRIVSTTAHGEQVLSIRTRCGLRGYKTSIRHEWVTTTDGRFLAHVGAMSVTCKRCLRGGVDHGR